MIRQLVILLSALHVALLSAREEVGVSLPSFVSDSVALTDVVVTGTRTPKTLADTPVLTRIITAKDIERSDATNVQDLLGQEVPGVEFSYAMNQQTHLNFAGFGGQSILFLVDGERLAGETLDDVDFSRLIMADVERIEIVKGASSALYGSSAGGGVINIITKEGGKPWTLHLDSRWSRHHAGRYTLQLGRNTRRISNLFTATFSDADNYAVHSAANPLTRVYSEVYGSKVASVKDRLTVNITDNLKLTGRLGYFYRQVARVPAEPERYRDLSAGLKASWHITPRDLLDLSYSFDEYDKSSKQQALGLDLRTYSNVQNAVRALYTTKTKTKRFATKTGTFTFGADFMRDYLYNPRLDNPRRHQHTLDAFVQYDWNITPRWELVGALRYDYISDGSQSHLTPKFSMRYKILTPEAADGTALTLRFGYGMGFRSPTLKEKYSLFDMAGIWTIQGTPDLKSERSNNFNIALSLMRSRYNIVLMGFCNTVRDKITTGVPTRDAAQTTLRYINLSRSTVYGMELTAKARWGSVQTTLGYTLTKERYNVNANGNINSYLPTRPHSLNLNVQWDHEFSAHYSIAATLNGRYLSGVTSEEYADYYDLSQGTVSIHYPAYTLWRLSLVHWLWQKVKVSLTLDNLFNYRPRYYYLNAPATDGTDFMLGLGLTL